MYSYFFHWRDSDYNLRRYNICLNRPHTEYSYDELVEAVKTRCAELHQPFDLPTDQQFRIFPDPR